MFSSLLYSVNYGWRVFGTGLAFTLFGLGGPIIAAGLAVFLLCIPLSESARCKLARNTIKSSFKLYIRFMKACGLLTYEVKGLDQAPLMGQLVVANHPSLLDVVFLVSILRDTNCIVKEGLTQNIFTRSPILAARYVCNNSTDLIPQSLESLAKGVPMVVFPEGTRTKPGQALEFQRGAANVALSAACDIVPVLISCTPSTLMKHQKWYHIPATPPHFLIEFQPAISISPYLDSGAPKSKSARQLTRDLVAYFTERAA